MREYFVNWGLIAFIAVFVAILIFLVGAEFVTMPWLPAALAGFIAGTISSVSYELGRMKGRLGFDWKRVGIGIATAFVFGFLGAWGLTL